MKITDFPTLIAGVLKGRAGQRRVEQLRAVIDHLNAGLAAGEIANKTFVDAKDTVNRALEEAFDGTMRDKFLDFMGSARDAGQEHSPEYEAINELYYNGRPAPHTAAGKLKKAAKLGNYALVAEYRDFITEIMPLADAITALKGKTVKRQVKSAEERTAERFTPPASSSSAVDMVKGILEEVVAESYDKLRQYIFDRGMNDAKGFLAAQAEVLAGTRERIKRFNKRDGFGTHEYFWSEVYRKTDSQRAGLVDKLITRDGWNDPYALRDDADAIMGKIAEEQALAIRLTYVTKNLKKLVSILEAKGDEQFLEAHQIKTASLGYLEGSMRINFRDGSGFTADNSVVFVVNSYGTQFLRFPLTFRDVKMPGGEKMRKPSEKAMNTTFLGK